MSLGHAISARENGCPSGGKSSARLTLADPRGFHSVADASSFFAENTRGFNALIGVQENNAKVGVGKPGEANVLLFNREGIPDLGVHGPSGDIDVLANENSVGVSVIAKPNGETTSVMVLREKGVAAMRVTDKFGQQRIISTVGRN
jgi:hypothetical protein